MIDKYTAYLHFCIQNVPASLFVGLSLFFCIGTILFLVCLGAKKGLKWSARLLLIECLVLLFILAVFARSVQAVKIINLSPFWSYRSIRRGIHHLLTPIIANVVAFIPIGLLLGYSLPRPKWWKVLLIVGAFSVLIETLQYVLRRGLAEFDDVWHNVVGGLVGYGVFLGIVWLVKWAKKKQTGRV